MRRWVRQSVLFTLVAVGVWQVGGALYILAKARLAQHLIADAWSRTLDGETQVRPWPWADTWPIARLRVPALNVDLYVLSDASGRSLAFGPGLLSGTAQPGKTGNTLISAHRDTHFRFLREIADGTDVEVQTPDSDWLRFRIVERHVLDIHRDRLYVASDRSMLTLMTCYPFDAVVPGGPLRIAVIAEPVPDSRMAAKRQSW